MAVLKNKTQGRYVIIGMAPMQDRTLSVKERGLLFTIMALPDNWDFSVAGLSKILPDGRESLGKIVQSLEDKGYLTRTQSRSEDGAFGGNVIEVHEIPVRSLGLENGQNPVTGNPATVNAPTNGQNPATDNPSTGKPSPGFPTQSITYKSNTTGILVSTNLSGEAGYERIREEVMDRIGYDALVHDYPELTDTIDLMLEILITVENTTQESIRVGREDKPAAIVRGQMRKLNMFHIQYVLEGLKSAGRIKNPTAYLLTSLYRAVLTMEMHTANRYVNDCKDGEWI